jgi:hypothetical protein
MSWISTSDPLALIAIQGGQIGNPAAYAAARGGNELDTSQRFTAIGEPVPIVFARFRNGKGGILISPGATEARFENDSSNNVTAYYHLVISEGQVDSIPVKDVFQRACRVGTHSQTYNRRAGTWIPGNVLVQRADKELPVAPYYCGTVGSYPDMSTLSFRVTIPDGFDQYNRQVHLFIRGGIRVTRLYDQILGPSDNFADLVRWLLLSTARVPSAIIDIPSLTAAATFLEVNSFTCNCYIKESTNYSDLIAKWAPYFLLCESNKNGKRGLRPVLPSTVDGAIDTGTIQPSYLFTESMIIPETFEINYTPYNDRQPFVVQVIWRQQLESGIGIIRTSEVRYTGTAVSGPYETHDISEFCTTESHAVKVGAYILAKRVYTTHTVRFQARPEAHLQILEPGDIIRIELQREATNYAPTTHNYLYQVERVTKTLAGDVTYEATHFPVDSLNRSLVALDVMTVAVTGLLVPENKTGVTCDINSSSDSTIPLETYTPVGSYSPTGMNLRGEGSAFGGSQSNQTSVGGPVPTLSGSAVLGGTLTAEGMPSCPGLSLTWMATVTTTGETTILDQIEGSNTYVITETDFPPAWVLPDVPVGNIGIFATGVCPNGESASSETIILDTRSKNFIGCKKVPTGQTMNLNYVNSAGSLITAHRPGIAEVIYARIIPIPGANNAYVYYDVVYPDGSHSTANGSLANVSGAVMFTTTLNGPGPCIG